MITYLSKNVLINNIIISQVEGCDRIVLLSAQEDSVKNFVESHIFVESTKLVHGSYILY